MVWRGVDQVRVEDDVKRADQVRVEDGVERGRSSKGRGWSGKGQIK